MKPLLRLLIPSLVLCLQCACAGPAKSAATPTLRDASPDPDVAALLKLNEQSLALARRTAPDAILRQVDTDLHLTVFRFTDHAATKEISILIESPTAPAASWKVDTTTFSKLTGAPAVAVDLQNLIVGPQRVAQAVTAYWPGCTIRALTLYPENGRLTWATFCNLPQGVVNGTMDAHSGLFQASGAPPAPVPVTSTPPP